MGASLYWEPTKRKKHSIPAFAPQSFMSTMRRVFGNETPVLNEASLPKLEALRDATEDSKMRECFACLIDAIERHEEIQISAQW